MKSGYPPPRLFPSKILFDSWGLGTHYASSFVYRSWRSWAHHPLSGTLWEWKLPTEQQDFWSSFSFSFSSQKFQWQVPTSPNQGSRMHIAHACRNLLKIARFSLSPSNLLQLFAHQPLNRQLGEQKNIADNFLSKQRFDLTQGVLGLLSALHMNTGGRQFFQVNQHLCALYQRQTPQNFFCRPWPYCRSATILLVTWWTCWF